MDALPTWIEEENTRDKISKYMSGMWKVKNEFTHNLDTLLKINGRAAIKKTPFLDMLQSKLLKLFFFKILV